MVVTLVFIISVVALVLAILAFKRTGGMTDLQEEVNYLDPVTDSLREKTANVLEKMEKALRQTDKDEEPTEKGQETDGVEGER